MSPSGQSHRSGMSSSCPFTDLGNAVVRFYRLKASRQAGVWDRIMDALAAGRAAALAQYSTDAQSQRPIWLGPYLYRASNSIERFFNEIKRYRRVATGYARLAAIYLALVTHAAFGWMPMRPPPKLIVQCSVISPTMLLPVETTRVPGPNHTSG